MLSVFLFLLLSTFLSPLLVQAGSIRLCVVEALPNGATAPLTSLSVTCKDEDTGIFGNTDDTMVESSFTFGLTNGCGNLNYETKDWDDSSNPDIYCYIEKAGYRRLYTDTLREQDQSVQANFGTVTMYPDRQSDPGPSRTECGGVEEWPGLPELNSNSNLAEFNQACQNLHKCYNQCASLTKEDCDLEFKAIAYSQCNNFNDSEFSQMRCKEDADAVYDYIQNTSTNYQSFGTCDHLDEACGTPTCDVSSGVCTQDGCGSCSRTFFRFGGGCKT